MKNAGTLLEQALRMRLRAMRIQDDHAMDTYMLAFIKIAAHFKGHLSSSEDPEARVLYQMYLKFEKWMQAGDRP